MARIRIIEVDADAEELAGLDIERLLREHAMTRTDEGRVAAQDQTKAIPSEIREYIDRKANQREHDFFVRFVAAILEWNAVRAELSGGTERDGEPRAILVRRLPQEKGAFAIVYPRLGRVAFRLPAGAAAQSPLAIMVPRGRMYQVRVLLTSQEATDAAVQLARQAYDEAVRTA
jgi:hypothetical protein